MVEEYDEADNEVGIRTKNIDIKKMFSSEKALYFIGEHNSEEIIIRISFESIERVKKKVGGTFK